MLTLRGYYRSAIKAYWRLRGKLTMMQTISLWWGAIWRLPLAIVYWCLFLLAEGFFRLSAVIAQAGELAWDLCWKEKERGEY